MLLRFLLMVLAFAYACPASGADVIAPGMGLDAAKDTLRRHDCDCGLKLALAVATSNEEHSLEFCQIEEDVPLVIEYQKSTREVLSLDVYFFPEHYVSKQQQVSVEALEIGFEEEGVYTLKLRRKPVAHKTD